ncbi:MAG: twin-arginine translocase TatA/TatE family subunit [Bacteroidetes bacterium]|nr:twin-arginine translocase TatA/TatE family subunit [Bacteroidota bacterium]
MLLFFDLGTGEILLILLVLFIVVGPRQLPEVARTVGKAINEMKRASAGFRSEIQKEADRLERESGLRELKKPLHEVADQASLFKNNVKNDDQGPIQLHDDTGAIPFGSAPGPEEAQSEGMDANKT